MENVSKASIHLRNEAPLISAKSAGSAREVLEIKALQGICKSFNARSQGFAQSSYLRRFGFNKVAEFNDPSFCASSSVI